MGLFKSKYEQKLDGVILKLNMNLSNNYKDNAQADLKELEELYGQYRDEGVLKPKALAFYDSQIGIYQQKLKGYSHKDQKPYWT